MSHEYIRGVSSVFRIGSGVLCFVGSVTCTLLAMAWTCLGFVLSAGTACSSSPPDPSQFLVGCTLLCTLGLGLMVSSMGLFNRKASPGKVLFQSITAYILTGPALLGIGVLVVAMMFITR